MVDMRSFSPIVLKGPGNVAMAFVEDQQEKKEARLVLQDLILGSHFPAVASFPGLPTPECEHVYVWRA